MKRFVLFLCCLLPCCDSGFQQIDQRVERIMAEKSHSFGARGPDIILSTQDAFADSIENTNPETINPSSDDLEFIRAMDIDAEAIAKSLDDAGGDLEKVSTLLRLDETLMWANANSKEVEFAEYEYLSTTLSLLGELRLWGPRFSNTVTTGLEADSTGGLYDTSLEVVNDFKVTQNLHNGGTITASALSKFAKELHSATASTTSTDSNSVLGLSIEIPLLRGSGAVARESLIQAKRDLVYAARTFERFRRTFYRDIVSDYLSLVVQKQSLNNAQMGVDSLRQLAKRQAALYESGRARLYDSADAENQALAAVARLSQSWEQYRLALDRFKIRIGWAIETPIDVVPTSLQVFPPEVDVTTAVLQALRFRLDLQNIFNRLGDTKRGVANALNDLLPETKLSLGATTASEDRKPVKFTAEDINYVASLSISLPLDREAERIAVRQQQIVLEKAKRSYRETRDTVAVEVRSALRNIEVYQFTLDLQERNVEIAQLGLNSINADPDRVSVLDQTRAISDLQSAKDARDSARRDLELSIVDYLLQAGQLRISTEGTLVLPVDKQGDAMGLQLQE
jgi:outer membrane protein TolC